MTRTRWRQLGLAVLVGLVAWGAADGQIRTARRGIRRVAGRGTGIWTCATTRASDGSASDVQSKVTASSAGDCVTLPAGTFTWNGSTVTASSKAIQVVGAGAGTEAQCGVGGQTTYTCISTTTCPAIIWQTTSTGGTSPYPTGGARLSGLTIEGESTIGGCANEYNYNAPDSNGGALVAVYGTSANFRMDHVKLFQRNGQIAFKTSGYVRGLVDHSTFYNYGSGQMIENMGSTWGGTGAWGGYGDTSWSSSSSVFGWVAAVEASGNSVTPFDKDAGQAQANPGTGTDALTSTPATTTGAGEYIFSVTLDTNFGATFPTQGTGFTSASSPNDNGVSGRLEYQIQGAAGSIAGTFTATVGTGTYLTAMATYLSAGTAGRVAGAFGRHRLGLA